MKNALKNATQKNAQVLALRYPSRRLFVPAVLFTQAEFEKVFFVEFATLNPGAWDGMKAAEALAKSNMLAAEYLSALIVRGAVTIPRDASGTPQMRYVQGVELPTITRANLVHFSGKLSCAPDKSAE